MALGFDRDVDVHNLNDTARLHSYLFDKDDNPVPAADIASVSYTVQKPDASQTTSAGTIQADGSGELVYTDTDIVGAYVVVATFTLVDGDNLSVRSDFEVIDPFAPSPATPTLVVGEAVWHKLEDLFDAEDEGPWLRDVTLNYFNKDKMTMFISEALFDINQQNPPTTETLINFVLADGTPTVDLPLLVQGTFISVLYHLITSYVEQPNPVGAQIAWQDRRDYLDRWMQVFQLEEQRYMRWLALWKRQFLHLGSTKLLLGSKAGRLIPAPMRSRYAGRGYW